MKLKSICIMSLLMAFIGQTAWADEGMWLLQLMKQQHSIDLMKKQGLKLEADELYNPNGPSLKDAVGIFGGGCTGEIISPNGLILTNHHCGYSSIQKHSSVEHDYLTDGFWATSQEEELARPGLKFQFVERIVDITDRVNADVKAGKVKEAETFTSKYLTNIADILLKESDLNGKPGISTLALPFYAGNKFFLFFMKTYTDVRMVAAPPSSIGKLGGETDNWMWPRHTGDFSVFRIYADKNGEPADYSKDNVPLQTKTFFPISLKGIEEGDYAMVMGFPGSTSRYLTRSEVKMRMTATNTPIIDIRTARLNALKDAMAGSDKIRIQYANKYAGSSNYWKNSIGMNKAIIDNNVLGTKADIEARFAEFAKGKPEYEGVVEKLDQIAEENESIMRETRYLAEAFAFAIEFHSPLEIMDNIQKGLQEKNDSLLQANLESLQKYYDRIHNKDYDHEVDRKVAKAIFPVYAEKIEADKRPAFYETIDKEFGGDYDAYIDAMYDKSILSNKANLEKFLKKPTVKAIEKDIATAYSRAISEKTHEIIKRRKPSADADLLHKAYIRGLNEMKAPIPSYPDANFTLRLTYGNVKSYTPRDAVKYNFFTTAEGILEKEDPDNREFNVPAKLKSLILQKDFGRYAMKDGSLPCCFLTTNDITGGNSGSPVINAEGQLIGAAFDGNWESLSGDIHFDDNLQRCIAVDIRYVLFVIEKIGGLTRLIDEMKIIE